MMSYVMKLGSHGKILSYETVVFTPAPLRQQQRPESQAVVAGCLVASLFASFLSTWCGAIAPIVTGEVRLTR